MNEQQLTAVKQAMEALKMWITPNWAGAGVDKANAAHAALQSIISQDALDKMADNARELGLDYEPAPAQEPVAWVEYELGNRKKTVQPAAKPLSYLDALKDAFFEGFASPETYNDRLLNSPEEAWAKYKPPVTTPPAAQPAVQEGRDWSLLEATQESLREHMAEIKRLKAAQPAPVKTYHDGKPWPVQPVPHECQTEAEKTAYAFGWWKAMEYVREHGVIK
jgi:hypothetical protein